MSLKVAQINKPSSRIPLRIPYDSLQILKIIPKLNNLQNFTGKSVDVRKGKSLSKGFLSRLKHPNRRHQRSLTVARAAHPPA